MKMKPLAFATAISAVLGGPAFAQTPAPSTKFVTIPLDQARVQALAQWANEEMPSMWAQKLFQWLNTQEAALQQAQPMAAPAIPSPAPAPHPTPPKVAPQPRK